MSVSFRETLPAVGHIEAISQVPAIRFVNETAWIFTAVQTAHLLSLAILGGAVFALNLRLMGGALQGVPAKTVERITRPWLIAGIVGATLTGLGMGISEVKTLLPSAAFFVKMVALVAAILFSVAVSRAVSRADDGSAAVSRGLAVAALALWAVSLILFATTANLGPGALLVALSGFGLFAVISRRHRRSYLIGVAIILGGGLIGVQLLPEGTVDETVASWVNLVPVFAALVLATVVGRLEYRSVGAPALSSTKLAAFASTLAWVTVAAAGRWIGFS